MTPKAKILLVDDEALVRDELGGLLVDEGYQVITGSDGQQGLELFRSEQPDMVITDMRMPRVSGLELVSSIRREAPATPVTVITGHGNEQMAIKALRAGVTDFIKKPVRIEDLAAALARMETRMHAPSHEPEMPASARLEERAWSYVLGSDRAAIPPFVDAVVATCSAGLDARLVMDLSLALRELILNAVEHGNLGLSYEEKTAALENGSLEQLLEGRLSRPPYAERQVVVTVRRQDDEVSFRVEDQGEGFDWRSLPDPTDPTNLLADHGRGVLLATMSVDDLTYNEAGTAVTIVKKLAQED